MEFDGNRHPCLVESYHGSSSGRQMVERCHKELADATTNG